MDEKNIITIVDAITGETIVREMTPEEIVAAQITQEPIDAE
jgi:hypothetical protein